MSEPSVDEAVFDRLGDEVAADIDQALASTSLPPLDSTRSSPRLSRTRLFAASGAALTLVAAAAVLLVFLQPGLIGPEALTFDVDGAPGAEGQWVEGRADVGVARFSDGSVVRLDDGAAARIVELTTDGARVSLERGSANVRVVHRDADTRWSVTAGPFDVLVVGTDFALDWDPTERVFELHMHEGIVELEGPVLAGSTRLRAGQSIVIDVDEGRAELLDDGSSSESPRAEAPDSDDPGSVSPLARLEPAEVPNEPALVRPRRRRAERAIPQEPTPIEAIEPPQSPAPTGDWRSLAESAQHTDAVAALDRRGLDSVLEGASAPTMLLVADTLRAARDPRAESVYRRVRGAHPSTPAASRAAFVIGRMLIGRDPAAAVRMLDACMAESPGPLRREAHGRLLEALNASGDPRVVAEARSYLARYPTGPHAEFARGLRPEANPEP